MRCGTLPTELLSPFEFQTKNIIGSNAGNLVYQYGIIRSLLTYKSEFIPSQYENKLSDAQLEQINSECTAHILPLSDAFRPEFMNELRLITKNVKKLDIPTIVTGVGLRAPYEPDLSQSFSFDEDVKEFMKAVLEKSAIVGVRGQITSDYLTKLGFKEGTHHTVIGSPGMYAKGREFEIRETVINEFSKVAFNSTSACGLNIQRFIMNNADKFAEATFLPQLVDELRLLYAGKEFISKADKSYPSKIAGKYHMDDNVKFFLNVPSRMKFLSNMDLCFGARLHGNIAALMSGTPAVIIPKDTRTREAAEYHNLTMIKDGSKLDPEANLLDIIEDLDLQAPKKVQKENFDHFIDFLDANGLEHVYVQDKDLKTTTLDLQNISKTAEVKPLVKCNVNEIVYRLSSFNSYEAGKIRTTNKKIDDMKKNIAGFRKQRPIQLKQIEDNKVLISEKQELLNAKKDELEELNEQVKLVQEQYDLQQAKLKEEAERLAKEEAEKLALEEAERLAQEEAELAEQEQI